MYIFYLKQVLHNLSLPISMFVNNKNCFENFSRLILLCTNPKKIHVYASSCDDQWH